MPNKPRFTAEEKEDYFHHFVENRPSGKIDQRFIEIDCNTAFDLLQVTQQAQALAGRAVINSTLSIAVLP